MKNTIKKIFQRLSKEKHISTSAPRIKPLWFTPVVQGVVISLWTKNDSENSGLRIAAVKYMQEEAEKAGEKIFFCDAINLIKDVSK